MRWDVGGGYYMIMYIKRIYAKYDESGVTNMSISIDLFE